MQQLQFTVKEPTVGRAATFSKVDNVIQETKHLMNVISKVVTTCFDCANKVTTLFLLTLKAFFLRSFQATHRTFLILVYYLGIIKILVHWNVMFLRYLCRGRRVWEWLKGTRVLHLLSTLKIIFNSWLLDCRDEGETCDKAYSWFLVRISCFIFNRTVLARGDQNQG